MTVWCRAEIAIYGGEFTIRSKTNKSVFANLPAGWTLRTNYGRVTLKCSDPAAISRVTPEMIEMWHCKVLLLAKQR